MSEIERLAQMLLEMHLDGVLSINHPIWDKLELAIQKKGAKDFKKAADKLYK